MANGVIVIRTGSRYVRYNEATVNAVISMRFVVRLKQLVHTAGTGAVCAWGSGGPARDTTVHIPWFDACWYLEVNVVLNEKCC